MVDVVVSNHSEFKTTTSSSNLPMYHTVGVERHTKVYG